MGSLDRIITADITAGSSIFAIKGLDINFDVNYEVDQVGTAQITIWNLGEATRNQIQSEASKIVLKAGKEELDIIFSGDIVFCEPVNEGVNVAVNLECIDGGIDYSTGRFSRSYPAGTAVKKIFDEVSKALLLKLQFDAMDLLSVKTVRPVYFDGQASKVLKNLTREYRLKSKFERGAVFIGYENAVANTKKITVPLLSTNTGLIGLPSVSFEKIENKNYKAVGGDIVLPAGVNAYGDSIKKTIYRKIVTATSVLNTDYMPGGQYRLETETFTSKFNKDLGEKSKSEATGNYYIQTVQHIGGMDVSDKFDTVITGSPL